MPLTALVDNVLVTAPLLSDTEWDQLKQKADIGAVSIKTTCCRTAAYMRISKRGIKHFVHKSTDCESQPETWQHLLAKQQIALSCIAAGYDTTIEATGDSWRADVLAVSGAIKLAFEFQWSPQSWQVTQERQQRYEDAGIRCCWFFRKMPFGYSPTQQIPAFQVSMPNDRKFTVHVSWQPQQYRELKLSHFLHLLLQRQVQWIDTYATTFSYRILVRLNECPGCGALYLSYYLSYIRFIGGKKTTIQTGARHYVDSLTWPEIKEYIAHQEYPLGCLIRPLDDHLHALAWACPSCKISSAPIPYIRDYEEPEEPIESIPLLITSKAARRRRYVDELPIKKAVSMPHYYPDWRLVK